MLPKTLKSINITSTTPSYVNVPNLDKPRPDPSVNGSAP